MTFKPQESTESFSESIECLHEELKQFLEKGGSALDYFKDLYNRGDNERDLLVLMLEYEEERSFDRADYYKLLADLYYKLGDRSGAIGVLKEGLTNYSDHVGLGSFLAEILIEQEDYDEAYGVLQILPEDPHVYWLKGKYYYDCHGDGETAIACFEAATQEKPENPAYYFDLGHAYESRGRFEEAFEAFQTGARYFSSSECEAGYHSSKETYEAFILHLFSVGENKKAYDYLIRAEEKFPGAAVDIYKKVPAEVWHSIEDARLCYDLSELFYRSPSSEDAFILAKKAVELDSENADFVAHLGSLYLLESESYQKALFYLRKAVELKPDELCFKKGLVEVLNALDRSDDEIYELADEIRRREPEDPFIARFWDIILKRHSLFLARRSLTHWNSKIFSA